jgi:hypothetical protein
MQPASVRLLAFPTRRLSEPLWQIVSISTRHFCPRELIRASLIAGYANILWDNKTLNRLISLYPDDPEIGCPFGTDDGVASSGLQDKRPGIHGVDIFVALTRTIPYSINALWTDASTSHGSKTWFDCFDLEFPFSPSASELIHRVRR